MHQLEQQLTVEIAGLKKRVDLLENTKLRETGRILRRELDVHTAAASDHHAKYLDAAAIAAVEGEATLDLGGAVGVTGLLTALAGLDLNSAGSIVNVGAAGNDWTQNNFTLAGGSAAQLLVVQTTGSGTRATLQAVVPAGSSSGVAGMEFRQGTGAGGADNMLYGFSYIPASNYFRLWSADTDGSATGADVLRVPDGGEVILLNANHGANFDFVCESCGRHEAEKFECCGTVEWHDDVALMVRAGHREPQAIELMHRLGVMQLHEDGWLGLVPTVAFDFTMSAMAQQYQRTGELEARIAALEAL